MSNPFVLKREATREPFVVQIGDDTLTFKHISELDQFALAELFAREDVTNVEFRTTVLRLAAASSGDFAKLREAGLTAEELRSVYDAYNAHTGTDEGES